VGKHEFGGDWTTEKLECVRKYLQAYRKIFTTNPKARKLRTVYVDAFAGTGSRETEPPDGDATPLFCDPPDPDAENFKKGSVRIALEVDPCFDDYLLIERHPARICDLEDLRKEFPYRSIRIMRGDANEILSTWCSETDWRTHRSVVFLDPYGMQVHWSLLEAIAHTKAIDLWVLFPLGVAVNRLLTTRDPPPTNWADTLTRTFGTDEWRSAFYRERAVPTLFGTEHVTERDANLDAIGRFFLERLRTVFTGVAQNPLPLCNSTNTPIYLLCFAAGNPKGATTAVKIAGSILSR